MTDLVYTMDTATDPTLVNTTGAASAAITSVPPGFSCTATSGSGSTDARLTASTTFARGGTTALKMLLAVGDTSIIRLPFASSNAKAALEFYHGATVAPSSDIVIATIKNDADVTAGIIGVNPDGSIYLNDATGGTVATSSMGAWVANRRNRFALLIDTSGGSAGGTATLRIYNDDGTTPTGTIGPLTGQNFTNNTQLDRVDLGAPGTSPIVWTEWFEDVQMGDGRTTEFGPYAPVAGADNWHLGSIIWGS